MSALHTTPASLYDLQKVQNTVDKMTNHRELLNREIRSLNSALDAQKRNNEKLQREMAEQRQKAERNIANLTSSFQQSEQRLQRQYAEQQEEINKSLTQQAESFQNAINQQKNDFENALNNQAQNFQDSLAFEVQQRQQAIDNLHHITQKQMQDIRADYTQITQKHQEEINAIKVNVKQLMQASQQSAQMAQDRINDLITITNAIQNNEGRIAVADYQKFAPNRLEVIVGCIQEAIDMLNGNQAQSSISYSQKIKDDLGDLESEVFRQKIEFDNEYNLTLAVYERLISSIKENEYLPTKTNQQEYGLDEWTNGKFSIFKAEVEKDHQRVLNNYTQLSLQDLQDLQNKNGQYEEKLKELLDEGFKRIVSSQVRLDMAKMIAKTLNGFHFDTKCAGYENGDKKQSYMVGTFRNSDNAQVTVAIIPDDDAYTNTIAINTDQPGYMNVADADQRTTAIFHALNEGGVQTGTKQSHHAHQTSMTDVYRITQQNSGGMPQAVKQAVINHSKTGVWGSPPPPSSN